MPDEPKNVDPAAEPATPEVETPSEDAPTDEPAPQPEEPAADAPAPEAEVKAGDTCTCPDGRVGTLHANEDGTFTCIPNQG